MGCKKIFNKEYVTAFCKNCICRYKLKFINDDKKVKNENQVLQTKENINIEEIKIKIDTDSEKKVIELNKNINSLQDYGKPEIGNLLINIMQSGADEFKEKTGRNMTYSEMRHMFG
jgi:hypothetical protein